MEEVDGERLIKITEGYENIDIDGENTGDYKDYRNEIRKQIKKLEPKTAPPAPAPSNGKGTIGTAKKPSAPPAPVPTTSTSTTTATTTATTPPPAASAAPATATEEDKNKVCYEELRKKLNMDSPNFEGTIGKIMESIPVDQMSAIIRDPGYKDVRSLISQMITMKISQFKTDLMAARGTVAMAKSEEKSEETKTKETKAEVKEGTGTGTASGIVSTTIVPGPGPTSVITSGEGRGTKSINRDAEAEAKTKAEAEAKANAEAKAKAKAKAKENEETYKKELEEMDKTIKEKLNTYGIKYGGFKAKNISNELIEELKKDNRPIVKEYYENQYEFQSKALCGLHALNNLFIEERKEKNFEKLNETLLKEICKIMVEKKAETTDNGCPDSGYYSINLIGKLLHSLGYNITQNFLPEEVEPKKETIKTLITNIKTNNKNLGIILGSGGHWTTLRRLNSNYVDYRNSIIPPKSTTDSINNTRLTEQQRIEYATKLSLAEKGDTIEAKTIDDFTPEIYNMNKVEDILNIFDKNGTIAYIVVNAGPSGETTVKTNPVNARIQSAITAITASVPSPIPTSPPPSPTSPPRVPQIASSTKIGGAKTRSKRRGIRVKKTKRRSKK
jgi:hypothetical protein